MNRESSRICQAIRNLEIISYEIDGFIYLLKDIIQIRPTAEFTKSTFIK